MDTTGSAQPNRDEERGGCDFLSASPTTLKFCAPFSETQKRTLTLLNTYPQPVLFKMKTNAANQYHVTPNFGRVEPFSSLEVTIRLTSSDTPANSQIQHHFSVYSTVARGHGVQESKRSILAAFKDIPCSKLAVVRINVEYEADPSLAPAIPLRTAAALEIRSAAERLIVNRVLSGVSRNAYNASIAASAANQSVAASAANQSVAASANCDPLESPPPLNLETSVRVSLNDITIPTVLQMILVGGALVGVLFILLKDPKKLDGVFRMLLGFGNIDPSEISQCGKSDCPAPAPAPASAPSTSCTMPDCCQGD